MDIPVNITNELERRIHDAFCLFDHVGNKTIDVREVGTILRFLGCTPTENEINEIISATEFEDSRGTVYLGRFMPLICQLLTERKMEPATPEKLMEAFEVLDPEGNGFVTKEYLSKVMMEEGEPFTKEELDEMMAIASDQKGLVPYVHYLKQLMYEAKPSVFDIAAQLEADRIAALPQPKNLADLLK